VPAVPGQTTTGLPSVDFYAPSFRIEVQGSAVKPSVLAEVQALGVSLDRDAIAGFQFTLANPFDPDRGTFKYGEQGGLFDLCSRVRVSLGYADSLVTLVSGQVTSLGPRFPESGPATIEVSGQSSLVLLRGKKPKANQLKLFTRTTDADVVRKVGARNGLLVEADDTTEQREAVSQGDWDELRLLRELAAKNDFECYVAWDEQARKDKLFFKQPTDGRRGARTRSFRFEWGKNLMSFAPELTIARQLSEVTVRGWDPRAKQAVSFTADATHLAGPNSGKENGPDHVRKCLGDKGDLVVKLPVTSQEEAKARAIALLRDRAYQFSTGSGQCIGQPELRPGDNVELAGLPRRFSGDYYVTKVDHSLGNSGFLTTFHVQRPGTPDPGAGGGGAP
jgi:uncharacterized protein